MLRFLCRYAVWLVSAYMIGGIVFLVLIESVFNGGFDFSMKILWLPLLLLIFGFTWSWGSSLNSLTYSIMQTSIEGLKSSHDSK